MYTVTMDGISYRLRVRYNTLERAFELRSGDNEGYMLSGRHERDLLGTGYSYQFSVEPDPQHPEDYDAFYEAVSAPVDSHEITMPYGQSTITFQAEVESGRDMWQGRMAGVSRWTGLAVNFKPIGLQRTPD